MELDALGDNEAFIDLGAMRTFQLLSFPPALLGAGVLVVWGSFRYFVSVAGREGPERHSQVSHSVLTCCSALAAGDHHDTSLSLVRADLSCLNTGPAPVPKLLAPGPRLPSVLLGSRFLCGFWDRSRVSWRGASRPFPPQIPAPRSASSLLSSARLVSLTRLRDAARCQRTCAWQGPLL